MKEVTAQLGGLILWTSLDVNLGKIKQHNFEFF
jgi:hypothetical protein